MRRRKFIWLVGGAAVWPFSARAQQAEHVRRVGVLTNLAADDPEGQRRVAAFVDSLQELGWQGGRNIQIEARWGAGDANVLRTYAAELAALAPSVILVTGSATVAPLMQATRTVPIVFVNVPDPVGAGYVASLAKPGGNVTGFTPYEYTTSGKWLELLKQIAPDVKRAGVIRDTAEPAGIGQLTAIQSVAASVGIKVISIDVRDAQDIERGIKALADDPNGGLIVLVGASPAIHRELIIVQSMQHQVPCVYPYRHFVTSGGLVSYGPDLLDEYRRAAAYADRILRGEKPADLPVQAPTKYELVINLKTAKALGLTVPPSLLARADEVIE